MSLRSSPRSYDILAVETFPSLNVMGGRRFLRKGLVAGWVLDMPCEGQLQTILYLSTSSGPGGAERVISNFECLARPRTISGDSVFVSSWLDSGAYRESRSTYLCHSNAGYVRL